MSVFRVRGVAGRVAEQNGGTVQTVHVDLGRIHVEVEVRLRRGFDIVHERKTGDCMAGLEVRLSVEVLRFDETNIFLLRGRANDNV